MKKIHAPSFKFHTIYSVILAVILLITIVMVRDITLSIVTFVLLAYVIGNGIIHGRKNELNRDSILEYILVSTIVIVVFLGIFFTR
jgi:hypothetical protein